MSFLPLPKDFDLNEWYIILSALALVFLLYKLPKRFPASITLLLLLFTAAASRVTDHLLAGPHQDLYDIMDTSKYELFDLFSYITYVPFSYVFIYIYDKYQLKGLKLTFYILTFSLGGVLFELLISADLIDFLHYKIWTPYMSWPVYLTVQPLTILFFELTKQLHDKSAGVSDGPS